ncbi:unnamed protein product [Orchesella dallaii]|uniref:Xanthine dehydrogenase n=1 Tax=Orchesella dallaii TaxID=48710 RepID=A0ABP1Q0G1_9HEXA
MGNAQSDLNALEGTSGPQIISFIINGKTYTVNPQTVDNDIGPEYKLVDFIRDKARLKGTKYMCREGGCGCCVVTARTRDSAGELVSKAVNSCLIPLLSCDGWEIATVESLGNQKTGYNAVQQRLVKFGGTQCGFCSSGMVMNMNSLLESNPTSKMKEIENSFDGNICRCTGYRPILDAFKSFASDCPEELKRKCGDIEELSCSTCPSRTAQCLETIPTSLKAFSFKDNRIWVKASSLNEAFQTEERFKQAGLKYRVVAGNTGTGVFKNDTDNVQAFLEITSIPEMQRITVGSTEIILGGSVTLVKGIETLKRAGALTGFQYTAGIAKHWGRIANTPIRNVATIAGNLMLKNQHEDFPSDVFITLEAVGAELSIASSPTSIVRIKVADLLNYDMAGKLVLSIHLKPLTKDHIFRSFKITRRYQNSHAYVNAAFCMQVDKKRNYLVVGVPNVVYGGITDNLIHASATERFLANKSLRDEATLRAVMQVLDTEIKPDSRPPDGSQAYRKRLTQTLLYKYFLSILGLDSSNRVRSGGKNLKRNVTKGQQTYDTDKTTWPINEPILKLESFPQVSGEAEYINDIDPKFGELFGAFVLSTEAQADLVSIDASAAENLPGVVKFIKASDIPGINDYMVMTDTPEEVFAATEVQYTGQPVGLVIAEDRDTAFKAVELVKVKYANISAGVVSIEEKILQAEKDGSLDSLFGEEVKSFDFTSSENVPGVQKIVGEFQLGSQYHFTMETHITICVPKEDGMTVHSSTQWMDLVQSAVASTLAIPANEIDMSIRRLGGGYGCKITRATQIACACAVAAYSTNRPVRLQLDLDTNMKMVGKRAPFLMKYEASVDTTGKIVGLKGKIFANTGMQPGEETSELAIGCLQSLYESNNWQITPSNISTNTPSNTWCRAPGTTPGIACIENVMEHIAYTLKLDPVAVRLANAIKTGDKILATDGETFTGENFIPKMLAELKVSGSIEERKKFINDYNLANRWKKRGLAIVPMRYYVDYTSATKLPVYVCIYNRDGTVAVSCGGIECGQGLNTKVAQAVAFELGVPMDKVKVKPSNNLVSPNTDSTGASVTSELCVFGAIMCCKILNERMKPIKDKAKGATWEKLVKLCNRAGIHLVATYMASPEDNLSNYNVWVVNATEVEIDCLTGESKIVRVDIIEDAGKSLNPEIDIGQVEGALIMGIGFWTTEKLIYSNGSPGLLTYNTWQYKPPLPKDIPEDIRITLLKDAPNPYGILRSKATAEPPLCSSVCVLFALKNAIFAARKEAGNADWFRLDGPVTPEDILLKCLTSPLQFSL